MKNTKALDLNIFHCKKKAQHIEILGFFEARLFLLFALSDFIIFCEKSFV